MKVPGSIITLHKSLTSPILLAGAPRDIALLNGTVCAAITLGLQSFYVLPLCIGIHIISVVAAKKDPYFFQVILRHLRKKKYYDV